MAKYIGDIELWHVQKLSPQSFSVLPEKQSLAPHFRCFESHLIKYVIDYAFVWHAVQDTLQQSDPAMHVEVPLERRKSIARPFTLAGQ